MDKHSKKSSSLLHYPVLVVFSLFFIGLFALDLSLIHISEPTRRS